ncbi:hypothetical protein GCM10009416_07050 [Craurococcus roseus]|uniref:Uncharacterized protein n=1 Tax=Craurococcus roseus TaxID=77585 RepID=A0ABP3PTL0_9PROT
MERFRCEGCQGRPVLAQWVDGAAGGPPSYPPVKRVPLALAWQKGPRAIN